MKSYFIPENDVENPICNSIGTNDKNKIPHVLIFELIFELLLNDFILIIISSPISTTLEMMNVILKPLMLFL
jgi:hypothetical protein